MTIERPDWSGGAPAPAETTDHQQLVADIANSDAPSQPSVPAKRGIDGITRADWGPGGEVRHVPATLDGVPIPTKKNVSGLPDWDRPRDEQGRYLSRSEAGLRAQRDSEGGSDKAIANVRATESAILAASADPEALQEHIAELPKDIALIAADYMRLTRAVFGQDQRFPAFLDALSEKQFNQFHEWWKGLSKADQNNILAEIGEI